VPAARPRPAGPERGPGGGGAAAPPARRARRAPRARDLLWALALAWALPLAGPSPARGWISSEWLGGWPGVCEGSTCTDDGKPLSEAPPYIRRNILEHQLASPACPSDLIFISLEYPENTGSPALDAELAEEAARRFREARTRALKLSCNDLLEGCGGLCLPVSMESRFYIHKSASWTLSIFRVDRFIGNFRRNRHEPGTVAYSFENYSLVTGKRLAAKDIFPEPGRAARAFWAEADGMLADRGACLSGRYRLPGNRPAGRDLRPGDILLSRQGATLALYAGRDRKCLPLALDLPREVMTALGAARALWDWEQ
jgi:hypothetical protein